MAEHQYIQLPPDSTGKKLMHRVEVILLYNVGTIDFVVGDTVVGGTSGAYGDITFVSGTTVSGEIHLNMHSQSAVTFTSGEDLEVLAVKFAEANGTGTPLYLPMTTLVSGENSQYTGIIDSRGSLKMKFHSGNPAVDITGRQEVVNPVTIAEYNFKYNKQSDVVSETIDGTATSTYIPLKSAVRFQCGTSSGDKVTKTSNPYHIIPEGITFGAIWTLWIGDEGKSNCRRRWGYFDAEDGWFFELNGTTLNAVQRSSATGVLVEWRVAQDDWNQDKVDGSGGDFNLSKVTLDVSKSNIYYMESAGGGGTTLGVYINGERIPVHSFVHSNYFSGVGIGQNNQLPLRWEQENTGTTASTSEMYVLSGIVSANTTSEALYNNRKGLGSLYTEAVSVGSDWTHMFSLRPAQTYQGKNNRAWIYPFLTTFISDTAAVVYTVSIAPSTTLADVGDGSWTQSGVGEYSLDSTNSTPFNQLVFDMAGPNEVVKCNHLQNGLGPGEAKLIRYSDITQSPMTCSVYCKSLGASTNVTMSFTWMELY